MANEETLSPANPLPPMNFPSGSATVTVRIMNTTCYMRTTAINDFMEPSIKGHKELAGPAYSFLIEHTQNGRTRRLVFDLGLRKDWGNLAPRIVDLLTDGTWIIHTDKNVQDVLVDGGNHPAEIEALIWSHWHFDHTGDPSGFPSTTDLIVGPGFKEFILPGYPANPNGVVVESDYSGRNLRELDFEKDAGGGLKLGQFNAIDYFGDGSFYLLDAPGHAIGHVCGLARTTASPPSFIFMGADSCHHGGEFRPSPYLPLPKTIIPNPLNPRRGGSWENACSTCPGSIFLDVHPKKSATEPFYELSHVQGRVAHDREVATETIEKIQCFDAAKNVLVCMAHDETLMDVIDFYPKDANDWMAKGWWEKSKWAFLGDFQEALGANSPFSKGPKAKNAQE